MELIEGKKYICTVDRFNCDFDHSFEQGEKLKFTGRVLNHIVYGRIYRFEGKRTYQYLRKEWVKPFKNNIKKLVIK